VGAALVNSPIILRPFQAIALDQIRQAIRDGIRRILLVAPTGAGKTTIAAALIESAIAKGNRILFLAHRKELIDQASARLDGSVVPHGVIMANHWRDRPHLPVQVGSVQTIIRRDLPWTPNIVIIDECHRARGESYQEVLRQCGNPVVIGLTATPVRTDGRGLGGNLFHTMVQCPQIGDLIQLGYLVPPITYGCVGVDLAGIGKSAGDYKTDELESRMNTAQLVGDVVEQWRKHASDRVTVVFAVSVKHSQAITEQFRKAGIAAEHLDGTTARPTREGILARLASGRTQVVVNCAVLTEGWDCPSVSCCVIARPTMSLSLYLQMAGRALRSHPGKTDCLILDHGNCWQRHLLVDTPREWELSDDKPKKKFEALPKEEAVKVCPECFRVCPPSELACACGYVFSVRKQLPASRPGELQIIDPTIAVQSLPPEAHRDYDWWMHQQHTRTKSDGTPYSRGYAYAKFVNKYKTKPPYRWKIAWEIKNLRKKTS
jgi:superfamily II DNA or RNA helicase